MPECTYNGVEFSDIHMVRYDQEAVLDPSQTDYLYTKISIGLAAILSGNVDETGIIQPGFLTLPPTQTPPDKTIQNTVTRIRNLLSAPRQRLTFTDDTSLLIDVTGTGNPSGLTPQFDVKNGPIARVFSITRFDGSVSYHVMWTVETYIVECPGTVQKLTLAGENRILSHRWTENQSIDKYLYTSYSRSGRVIIASSPQRITADQAGRPSTFVPLRNGFRREQQEYTISEDGLGLQYRIADRQLFRTMPNNVIDAKASYSERTGLGATMRDATIAVRLFGTPLASQQELVTLAMLMATQRLAVANFNPNLDNPPIAGASSAILKGASVSYDFFENVVDVNLEANLPPVKVREYGLPLNVTSFVVQPYQTQDYSTGKGTMPVGGSYGNPTTNQYNSQTANQLILVAAALGVPCSPSAVAAAAQQPGAKVQIAAVTAQALASAVDAATAASGGGDGGGASNYNSDAGLYTDYAINAHYRDRQCILQMPTATPAGGSKVASIVQWANPIVDMVLDWTASRVGNWPEVPSKEASDDNLVYVDSQITPGEPILRADGKTVEYMITGKYYYAVIDPDQLVMRTGLPAYLSEALAPATEVPDDAFSEAIMNPGSSGGGGSGGTAGQIPQVTISS